MASPPSSPEDELDKLTRAFEEQAAKDLRKKPAPPKPQRAPSKSMKTIREEGLALPLSEKSKGFKLLSLMGYEKGQGLGKDSTGRSEPLPVELRDGRLGLGVPEERKRKREESTQKQEARGRMRQEMGDRMQEDFAKQQAAKLADRRYEGQLTSARKVIETLDTRKGLPQSFLWPPLPEPESGDDAPCPAENASDIHPEQQEASWEDQSTKDKLTAVLKYLRNHHQYCIHCGCQYDSPEDLEQHCPGMMDEDH